MYVQTFVKGIAGPGDDASGLSWEAAKALIDDEEGLISNWWRSEKVIDPKKVADVLTAERLDWHLHDYENHGHETPFISLAAGSVERNSWLMDNFVYPAQLTALAFATSNFTRAGSLFYGWTIVGLSPAIPVQAVSESIRELHVYSDWSDYQLEGEITAKINIPANQIERIEWWDPTAWNRKPNDIWRNDRYQPPAPILNFREFF